MESVSRKPQKLINENYFVKPQDFVHGRFIKATVFYKSSSGSQTHVADLNVLFWDSKCIAVPSITVIVFLLEHLCLV